MSLAEYAHKSPLPYYIKKQRFWLDLKLIALSCWITFRGTWEHRGKKF